MVAELSRIINKQLNGIQNLLNKVNAGAQYNLGIAYYEGEGVEQDYKQAVEWWKKSAEQGNAVAQA